MRRKFTKWYYRKGYRMSYEPGSFEMIFDCPIWVRPLTWFFFSPSTYYREFGLDVGRGFEKGWLDADLIDFADLRDVSDDEV